MTEVQRLAKIMLLKDMLKEYELLAKYNGGTDYDRWKALDIAINALEQEPCSDAISRQAVLDLAEWFDLNQQHFIVANLIDEVENMPSVTPQQPQQRTGYWEWVQYDGRCGNWHCSECRTIIPHMPEETDNTPIYKWCPMCGARMEEGNELL